MKRVIKGEDPLTLLGYKACKPDATWDDMRNDPFNDGRKAAKDCLNYAINNQKGLCAYCETKLDPARPQGCRVEHFHPKSGTSAGHNWHLDWHNMLAACNGGERDESLDTPLPDNLSCDAHKNHLLGNKGRLAGNMKEELVNPLDIPAFPNVFAFSKGSGHLQVDSSACLAAGVDAGKLQRTIEVLNLNCHRLSGRRHKIVIDIDKNKKKLRLRNYRPEEAQRLLAKRYFGSHSSDSSAWPEFFTAIRCCLGQAAETYLQEIRYKG
jgi:uncharacterized protein (TIGR02646 family)